MYSTKLDDNRIVVQCVSNNNCVRVNDFIVDTGAKYTCIKAELLDKRLKKDDFKNSEKKIIGGLVKGYNITFYKLLVKQFTIGNVDVGSVDIWVTFDERISDPVLGFDILGRIGFAYDEQSQLTHFSKKFDEIITYYYEIKEQKDKNL